MDACLSQLDKAWNEDTISNHHENEEIDNLGEELDLVLGEDFSSLIQENALSSLLNYCTQQNSTNLLDQTVSNTDKQLPSLYNNLSRHKDSKDNYFPRSIIEPIVTRQVQNDDYRNNENGSKELSDDQQSTKNGKRKRRDPEQVNDHILAERKRRQILAQRFIALSALVPGLKKADKTSILEEAIKHVKQMQEQIKLLEEEVVSNQAVRPMTVSAQLIVDNNESNSSIDNNTNTCISGDTFDGDQYTKLPEIEVKVSHKTVILRIYCVKRKGILGMVYDEVENCHMKILNCNVIAFESSALDITIVAQV
ncbi:hypothetical protein RND81_13G196300 [Saponaria officinalis]|uniref:BHLH domain-containing protein n=1 Tax=Saponaria officinalis TaxID=3572 RepID=A0AAW1H022_SAPOF